MQTRRARGRLREDAAEAPDDEAQHGAAMLRLALELKKPGAPPFDTLVSEVSQKLRLHEPSFRRFLAQQGDFFTALATGRG